MQLTPCINKPLLILTSLIVTARIPVRKCECTSWVYCLQGQIIFSTFFQAVHKYLVTTHVVSFPRRADANTTDRPYVSLKICSSGTRHRLHIQPGTSGLQSTTTKEKSCGKQCSTLYVGSDLVPQSCQWKTVVDLYFRLTGHLCSASVCLVLHAWKITQKLYPGRRCKNGDQFLCRSWKAGGEVSFRILEP